MNFQLWILKFCRLYFLIFSKYMVLREGDFSQHMITY